MADLRKHIQTYELDLSTGKIKADGPEDHARAMEAIKAYQEYDLGRVLRKHAPQETQPTASAEAGQAATELLAHAIAALPKPTAAGKRLRELLEEHLKEEARRLSVARTVQEKTTLFHEFAQFFGGEIFVNQITKTEISERWRKAELVRPSQKVSKVKLARLAALAEEGNADAAKPPTLSLPRLEKRRGYLKIFFDWAIDTGAYMHENPMSQKIAKKKDLQRATTPYREYSAKDLSVLFGTRYVAQMQKPDWYWVPLIALFSGARLNEIASLNVQNFEDDGGIKLFDVKDAKSRSGKRTVPIHSKLLSLGLWNYVEFIRTKGESRLFWFRPRTVSKSTGEIWGKYVDRCGIDDASKVFHSFRSTAITSMHNDVAPNPSAIRSGVGHTGGLTGAHGGYVRGSPLKLIQAAIESVTYPSVDIELLRLEDPTFGEFYEVERARLNSPKFALQQERRKRRAALQAERAMQVAARVKRKGV